MGGIVRRLGSKGHRLQYMWYVCGMTIRAMAMVKTGTRCVPLFLCARECVNMCHGHWGICADKGGIAALL